MRIARILAALVLAIGLTTVAFAGVYEDSFSMDADTGDRLVIEVALFDLDVRVADTDRVSAEVYLDVETGDEEDFIKKSAPVITRDGNRIIIKSAKKNNWSWFKKVRIKKARITLTIPEYLESELGTASGDIVFVGNLDASLSCDTASGDIQVDGSAQEFHLDTASGDILATLSRATRVFKADTASGDIVLTGGADKIHADTASGNIEADGLRGEARLDTASGDIRATWSRIDDAVEIRADSASGDIVISLPGDVELDGSVDTASGDIDSDFRGNYNRDRDHLTWEGGTGAVRLRIDTASGDVTIKES